MNKYTITEFRKDYPDDDTCLDKIFQLRFSNLVCPKCEHEKCFSKVHDRRSYQCKNCGFQIYPTAGTIFEKTTTPLTIWFYAIFLQTTTRNGVAAKEFERQFNVCYKTALRMAHQIKILMANKESEPFTGIIEGDETYIGGENKNRHANKKVKGTQGRSTKDKTPVFGLLQRGGNVSATVLNDVKIESIKPVVNAKVEKGSTLVTDDFGGYKTISEGYYHLSVNHKNGEYVRGMVHTM